jgi:protein TonB
MSGLKNGTPDESRKKSVRDLRKKYLLELLCNLKREQLFGLLFVLVLHGAVLYRLWSYRIIPAPDETIVLMVNLINPPLPEQPKPELPKLPKPHPPDLSPPEHLHLAVEAPVVLSDEPVVYVPPPPPVIEAPPLPPQLVILASELSVSCPDRSPPDYPSLPEPPLNLTMIR